MPYDSSHPRAVTALALERLRRSAGFRPRVAFAGEFSAGKSTLINRLIGYEVLPAQATATALPPVWMSYGSRSAYYMSRTGVQFDLPGNDLSRAPADCRYVRLFVESEMLRACDFIDLPGFSDPGRSDGPISLILKMANIVVWCTPATQAWRQSERSTWLSLPARLRSTSLVAVTRADKLNSDEDRFRVLRRVLRETSGLFAGGVAVSAVTTPSDLTATPYGLDVLQGHILTQVDAERSRRLELLDRYVLRDAGATAEDLSHVVEEEALDTADLLPLSLRALGLGEPVEPVEQPDATDLLRLTLRDMIDTPAEEAEPEAATAAEAMVEEEATEFGNIFTDLDDTPEAVEAVPDVAEDTFDIASLVEGIVAEEADEEAITTLVADVTEDAVDEEAPLALAEDEVTEAEEAPEPEIGELPEIAELPVEVPAIQPAAAPATEALPAETAQNLSQLETILQAIMQGARKTAEQAAAPVDHAPVAQSAVSLSRAPDVWRQIVRETPEAADHPVVVGMIERLLTTLFQQKGPAE